MKIQKTVGALALALSLLTGCAAVTPGSVGTSAGSTVSNSVSDAAAVSDGVQITFTDSGVTAASTQGLELNGTALTVTQSGVYTLSGSCANGSVRVDKGVTDVTLILNGLNLTAEATAPILCGKGSAVTILAAAGTENTLSDTAENNDETGSPEGENAVIKCKDGTQVVLCGTGTLNLQAKGKNGIKSGASTEEAGDACLTIRELTLNIDAPVNDAVNAEAALNVESGTLLISAGDDALHCDYTLNIGAENTEGPAIQITDCYEGLEGATVNVYSGNIRIRSEDDCVNAANADLTGFDYQLNIFGGTVDAFSTTGDGFDSNGDLTISGGNVTVYTANTADNEPLDADGTVTISGGTVLAAGGSSGMGLNLSAVQPCVIFGGSTDGSRQPGQSPKQSGEDTPPEAPSQSGESTPPELPADSGRNGMGGEGLLTEDSEFSVTLSDGTVLYTGTAYCNASFVLFSSDGLSGADSGTLICGDNRTESTVQTGTVSTGMGGRGGFGGQFAGKTAPDGSFGRRKSGEQAPKGQSQSTAPTTSGGTAA